MKDFAANYQVGETDVMECALYNFIQSFAEHWGQKLLNALRALHALRLAIVLKQKMKIKNSILTIIEN